MIELLVILVLWGKMGERMKARGFAKPIWFQVLVPASWLGGAFFSAIVREVIRLSLGAEEPTGTFEAYLWAFGGAVLAMGLLFLITSFISRKPEVLPPPLPEQGA